MSGGNWKDLFKAAGQGDAVLIRYHLKQGVDPNFQHAEYFSCPIFEAIRCGQLEAVKLLIEEGNAKPDDIEELTDQTPVEAALEEGHHDIVDYLNTKLPLKSQWKPQQVLVTGGNRGLGRTICKQLLNKGHRVVFTCRSQDIGEETKKQLKEQTKNSKVDYIVGDLSSINSTHSLADAIAEEFPSINVLIHNAGVWPTALTVAEVPKQEGLELAFMVHYMAPHILNERLASTLQSNGRKSRIIFIRDVGTYLQGKADLTKTPFGKDFGLFSTYWNVQQCGTILFWNTVSKFQNTNVEVMTVYPGRLQTELGMPPSSSAGGGKSDEFSSPLSLLAWQWYCKLARVFAKSVHEGAAGPVWLASSPDATNLHGKYYEGMKQVEYPELELQQAKDWKDWTLQVLHKY